MLKKTGNRFLRCVCLVNNLHKIFVVLKMETEMCHLNVNFFAKRSQGLLTLSVGSYPDLLKDVLRIFFWYIIRNEKTMLH